MREKLTLFAALAMSAIVGCTATPAAAPTPAPTSATGVSAVVVTTVAPSPTARLAASPTSAPTPTVVLVPSPTLAPTPRPASTPSPAVGTPAVSAPPSTPTSAISTAALPSIAELASRAQANPEYSFEHRMSVSGVAVPGKVYVKGKKMRQELRLAGRDTVIIMDLDQKLAYMLDPDGETATKVDLSELIAQGTNVTPTERVQSLPSDARLVGAETLDGKPTAVYEVDGQGGPVKLWIWVERGVPLKMELPNPTAPLTVEMSNYQFGPQPASLFELPAGTRIVEMPGIPTAPGKVATPTPR
jgi:hypothetical protein